MKVSATKPTPRVERNQYLTGKRIKGYGDGNDYPQKVLEIIGSSGTGKTCLDIYVKFVRGSGFIDSALNDEVINVDGERISSILKKNAKDLSTFNGFATLIKYDYKGMAYAYYNIPFEQCRIEINGEKNYTGRIGVHPDWTGITGKRFRNDDVVWLNRFAPENVPQEIIEDGGPELYSGQIFYYTADGDFEYPICPFDPVVTDMLTEDSVSTVKHRNAKNNFLPSGMIVRKGIKPKTLPDGTIDPNDPYNQEQIASANWITKAQGDMNTAKLWVIDIDSDEEMPEFVDFTPKNYDRQYELTEKTIKQNIGEMFKMPPVLRGVDVGTGFGAELISNAYSYMNSVTGDERDDLETAFMDMFIPYTKQFSNFKIQPRIYIATETPTI